MNPDPIVEAGPLATPRITVAAFTQGVDVPSARFRVRQLIPELARHGIRIDELLPRSSAFPPVSKFRRPGWLMREALTRIPQLVASRRRDLSIIQREFVSTLAGLEAFTKRPRVFDVDDAIWLHRGGFAADFIARRSDHIVCGNGFLADYFSRFGRPISIIPTTVDVNRFKPVSGHADRDPIIGWSGSSSGYRFLYRIESMLAELLRRHRGWRLRVVGDVPPLLSLIPTDRAEFVRWTGDGEAGAIGEMDIGLMPLDDSDWSRGKCSYKMLLYMSCGLPVVVSDVGMNSEILRRGEVGVGVRNNREWTEALDLLMNDQSRRAVLGANGRALVEASFSLEVGAASWVKVIDQVAVGR